MPRTIAYEQDYHGATVTFGKRYSNDWSLMGSYTWSKSEGLSPRPWYQAQNNPFYGSTVGQDPNSYLNARGFLQADRPHMLRIQGVWRLPYDIMFSTGINIESGKPYNRQIRVFGFNQATPRVIMAPSGGDDVSVGGTLRRPTQKNIDLMVGKRFYMGDRAHLRADLTIYNLLNDDADLFMQDLRLQDPDDDVHPEHVDASAPVDVPDRIRVLARFFEILWGGSHEPPFFYLRPFTKIALPCFPRLSSLDSFRCFWRRYPIGPSPSSPTPPTKPV